MDLNRFLHHHLKLHQRAWLPSDFGILTASNAEMFVGIQLLYTSIVQTHKNASVAACDFGWTSEQRAWARRQPRLQIIEVPDAALLARPPRPRWVEWNRSLILLLSPFARTFYMDADTVLLQSLEPMVGHMQRQPFIVINPVCTPNDRALYSLLPGTYSTRENFTAASGVSGWHKGRDDAILAEWMSLTRFILSKGLEIYTPMPCEGVLRAVIQKLDLFPILWPDMHWNALVYQRHGTVTDALADVRTRYPQARVLHFYGRPKPWEAYDDALLDINPHWGTV